MSDINKLKAYCNKHTDKRIKFAKKIRSLKKVALVSARQQLDALSNKIIKLRADIVRKEVELEQIDSLIGKLENQKL